MGGASVTVPVAVQLRARRGPGGPPLQDSLSLPGRSRVRPASPWSSASPAGQLGGEGGGGGAAASLGHLRTARPCWASYTWHALPGQLHGLHLALHAGPATPGPDSYILPGPGARQEEPEVGLGYPASQR